MLALQGHQLPPQQALAAAHRALQLSPRCCEAFNVLATHANSLEAALELYRTAERLGFEVILSETILQDVHEDEEGLMYLWKTVPFRGVLR